jgi:hypothetical protein
MMASTTVGPYYRPALSDADFSQAPLTVEDCKNLMTDALAPAARG